MAEMVKIKLLKKLYRHNVGDVIEVRTHEAKALIATKIAEDYIATSRRRTQTRVMEPATPTEPVPETQTTTEEGNKQEGEKSEEEQSSGQSGVFGRLYNRRDMLPEDNK